MNKTIVLASNITMAQGLALGAQLQNTQWAVVAVQQGERPDVTDLAWKLAVPGERSSANALWSLLGDVPTDAQDDIEEEWFCFQVGTSREAIWAWFEDSFNCSVTSLMGIDDEWPESQYREGGPTRIVHADLIHDVYVGNDVQGDLLSYEEFLAAVPTIEFGRIVTAKLTEAQFAALRQEYIVHGA